MKLYNSVGPNPQVVRTFMAERGITIEMENVDIIAGVNRAAPFLAINAGGQLPVLALDDGSIVTEITAICEYLDETHPGASLIGATPEERAQTRRWMRWADLNVVDPITTSFRGAEGLPLFKDRLRCIPEASAGLKAMVQDSLRWLDTQMIGKAYLAGDRFSLADIVLFSFVAFGESVGQARNPEFANIDAWFARVKSRKSASA